MYVKTFRLFFTLLPKDKINFRQETRIFYASCNNIFCIKMQLFFKILTKRFASHMNFIEILSCDINIQKEEKTLLKLSCIVFDQKRVKMLSKLENLYFYF